MNLTHAVFIAASLYVFIQAFKAVFPEWKNYLLLVRFMPVLPVILGVIIAPLLALFAFDGQWLLSIPYGAVGGALSSSCYELIHKTLLSKKLGDKDL